MAKPSLPSAALPASGSRGRPISRTSQPSGSPALFSWVRIRRRDKSARGLALGPQWTQRTQLNANHIAVASVVGSLCEKIDGHGPPLQKMSIKRGRRSLLRCCLLFYVGLKDRVPSAVLHLPDRRGVVVARGVLPVRGAFHHHCVGHVCPVRIGHCKLVVTKSAGLA